MWRVLVVVSLVALSSACGDEQLERVTEIKDEVCACKTSACGEAAMKKVAEGVIESTRKTQRLALQMMECMKKLYDGERPTTDPDAESPEPVEPAGSDSAAQ